MSKRALAYVVGDINLVRALGRAGVPVVLATWEADDPVARSRWCVRTLAVPAAEHDPAGFVDALVQDGRAQDERPVLYYSADHDLLAVSRHRDALATAFRFVVSGAELVEDTVDKQRFQALAERLALPVPRTLMLHAGDDVEAATRRWDTFPCIVKPAVREGWFESALHGRAPLQKALRIESRAQLRAALPALAQHPSTLLLQEAVPGGEEHLLSYHAYVRDDGEIAAEATGKKLRTFSRVHGVSTYVETTDDQRMRALGRSVMERVGLTGVVKIDVKRDPDTGRLVLLELNTRFNMWHLPLAVAGANIPALVYDDVTGKRARRPVRARPGVRWLSLRHDVHAAREYVAAGELRPIDWLRSVATADVVPELDLRDPLPGAAVLSSVVRAGARRAWAKVHAVQPTQDARKLLGTAARRALAARASTPASPAPLPRGFAIAQGRLTYQDVDLPDLLAQHGTPLHVVLVDALIENARAFTQGADAGRELEAFYSYKTNPVPGVLARLRDAGVGAEVISAHELWLARRLGVPGARIIVNGPAKTRRFVDEAIVADVCLINLNHEEEIDLVAAAARDAGRRARVGLRVQTTGGWGGHFGVSGDAQRIAAIAARAAAAPELDVVALHAHRGAVIRDARTLLAFVDEVLALADVVRAAIGRDLEILDLGGSLDVPTIGRPSPRQRFAERVLGCELPTPALASMTPGGYAALVAGAVCAHHRARGLSPPRIFIEPGRAMTGNTQVLLSTTTSTRTDPGARWAVLDVGIHLADCVAHERHRIVCATRADARHDVVQRLTGPLCTPADVLSTGRPLPPLAPGDVLAILDCGAYAVPFSSQFSNPRPAIVAIEDGVVHVLRDAETSRFVFALDREFSATEPPAQRVVVASVPWSEPPVLRERAAQLDEAVP